MPDKFTPRVKDVLRAGGCRFDRQGKGDHETWWTPTPPNPKHPFFMVDNNIKSRHIANLTLKNAGLPKHF